MGSGYVIKLRIWMFSTFLALRCALPPLNGVGVGEKIGQKWCWKNYGSGWGQWPLLDLKHSLRQVETNLRILAVSPLPCKPISTSPFPTLSCRGRGCHGSPPVGLLPAAVSFLRQPNPSSYWYQSSEFKTRELWVWRLMEGGVAMVPRNLTCFLLLALLSREPPSSK